jgi:phage gp36-like protein
LIELQNAQAGLFAGLESIRQAQAALDASRQSLDAYRVAYRLNQVDLVFLNLVEPKVTENQIKLYEQQLKLFMSLAAKQAALGLDPLEQAIALPNYLKTQKEKEREELEANAPKANEGK